MDLASEVGFLNKFLDRIRTVVDVDVKKLRPHVLKHFNDWASTAIVPLFLKRECVLQDSKNADYHADRRGFLINLGDILHNGSPIKGEFWDEDIYESIEQYREQTPWVYDVETGFYLPK